MIDYRNPAVAAARMAAAKHFHTVTEKTFAEQQEWSATPLQIEKAEGALLYVALFVIENPTASDEDLERVISKFISVQGSELNSTTESIFGDNKDAAATLILKRAKVFNENDLSHARNFFGQVLELEQPAPEEVIDLVAAPAAPVRQTTGRGWRLGWLLGRRPS